VTVGTAYLLGCLFGLVAGGLLGAMLLSAWYEWREKAGGEQ
jgi:hypothetical protein